MAREEARAGLTLLSPTLILVLAMVVLPILWTLLLAFQRVRILNIRSAGIFGPYTVANFDNVFSGSFFQALGTTLAYSVFGTAGAIVLGLIAALALRKPFKGRTLIRASMLLPYVAPIVAVTVYNFLTARGDIGAASAQALVLALILGIFVSVYIKFFTKKEEVS